MVNFELTVCGHKKEPPRGNVIKLASLRTSDRVTGVAIRSRLYKGKRIPTPVRALAWE